MINRCLKIIFVVSFVVSFIFLGLRWNKYIMVDSGLWANQAQYVLSGDQHQFDFMKAYGHPGGPIIEGTVAVHKLSGISYNQAVIVFVVFICSFFIAGICVICFLLNKNNLWWLAAPAILVSNWLYQYGTPPSIVASILISFLCLLTLYIYENKTERQNFFLVLWAVVAGASMATRADIGLVSFAVFLFILSKKIGWKKMVSVAGGTILSFAVFDPFMWFMPVRHVNDLLFNFVYHWADFVPKHLDWLSVLSISSITFISVTLSVFFLLWLKQKESSPLPPFFAWTLIGMTVFLYAVFLSARFQTERYFLPVIFIWEIFFPLFLFSLIKKIGGKSQTLIQIGVIIILVLYHTFILTQNIWTCHLPCI